MMECFKIFESFIEQNTYPYEEDPEVVKDAPKFPYERGAAINESVLAKIHEWEVNARKQGWRLKDSTYLMVALFKIHIGYSVFRM